MAARNLLFGTFLVSACSINNTQIDVVPMTPRVDAGSANGETKDPDAGAQGTNPRIDAHVDSAPEAGMVSSPDSSVELDSGPKDAGALDASAQAKDSGTRDSGPVDAGTGAADSTCDMNGIWIGRQTTRSQSLGAGQFSNAWYYLEMAQSSGEVVVTKHFDCGIEVRGSVTVLLSKAGADALRGHNLQTGRRGTMEKTDGNCVLRFDRFWSIRGASEETYAPSPRNSTKSIAEAGMTQALPTKDQSAGAEDWDGDGELGTGWQITGILSGTRNSVQRDWTEWFTDATHAIAPASDFTNDLVVRAAFDSEETILDATSPALNTTSSADSSAQHTLTLRFLGRSKSDARAVALAKATDFDTCQAVQAALPVQDKL